MGTVALLIGLYLLARAQPATMQPAAADAGNGDTIALPDFGTRTEIAGRIMLPGLGTLIGETGCSPGYLPDPVACVACVGVRREVDPRNANCARCTGSCEGVRLLL